MIVTDLNGITLGKFDTIAAASQFMGVRRNTGYYAMKRGSVVKGAYRVFEAAKSE